MLISDYGIIVSKKALEENSGVITVFTKDNGLYSGYVKKLSSKTGSCIYQVGNLVDFIWTARLQNHIGTVRCELIKSYSAKILHHKIKLYLLNSILNLISTSLKPHEKYTGLFDHINLYMENLSLSDLSYLSYIKAELAILSEVGYSLDISKCAITGSRENLAYISPKTGKAASIEAGRPYASHLLVLPSFLLKNIEPESITDMKDALNLTGYFFKRYIFHNGAEPNSRTMLYGYIDSCSEISIP